MDLRDIELYLPKYLSPETEQNLFEDLSLFPENIDQRMYMEMDRAPKAILQGDGLDNLLLVEIPSLEIKYRPSMILSNTCDIDPANKRLFTAHTIYAPIIKLEKYRDLLLASKVKSEQSIDGHLDGIRRQSVTQIFYLPPSSRMLYEGIVFFDRVQSCRSDLIGKEPIDSSRIFTLSQYGQYLFLFKLSIHFTRITEKIDRAYSVQRENSKN
jgi:hypothetical protein